MLKTQNDRIEKLMKLLAKSSVSYEDDNAQNEDQSAQESGESSDSGKRNNSDGVIEVEEDYGEEHSGDDDEQSWGVRFDLGRSAPHQDTSSDSDDSSQEGDESQDSESESSENSSKGRVQEGEQEGERRGEDMPEDEVEKGQTRTAYKTNITAEMLDQAKKQKNRHAITEINAPGGKESGFHV